MQPMLRVPTLASVELPPTEQASFRWTHDGPNTKMRSLGSRPSCKPMLRPTVGRVESECCSGRKHRVAVPCAYDGLLLPYSGSSRVAPILPLRWCLPSLWRAGTFRPRSLLACLASLGLLVIPAQASEADAIALSANIQAQHLPFG